MPDRTHPDFLTTPLDPGLLSMPFETQTNWHVITGAPSCGKTTLLNLLSQAGFRTVPETARQVMETMVASGRTIEQIHARADDLQRAIIERQLAIERGLPPEEVLFLDGAVPGSLSWFRVFGLDPNEILPACFQHRYASVFILDRFPLELDGLRFEDRAIAGFLDEWHTRDYRALGYRIRRVPVLPPNERRAWVLERLV